MTDRFVLIQFTHTSQRENPPTPVAFLPIEWRLPALLVDSVPAERKPELRSPIAAILDKLAMMWTFVIEMESNAFIANLADPRWKRQPRHQRYRSGFRCGTFTKNRPER